MTEGCPWAEWEQASLFFCEERLCAFVQTPSNTYSNVAYLIVGLALLSRWRAPFTDLGVIALLVAFGSFMFHASGTYFFEIWDVGAMFLFSGYALVANARRVLPFARTWSTARARAMYATVVALSVLAMIAWKGVGVPLFAVQVTLAGAFEVRAYRKLDERCAPAPAAPIDAAPPPIRRAPLFALLALFAIAWGAWWLDVTHAVCDPTNHVLQGHAIWHITNSLCFVALARFYDQFPRRA